MSPSSRLNLAPLPMTQCSLQATACLLGFAESRPSVIPVPHGKQDSEELVR